MIFFRHRYTISSSSTVLRLIGGLNGSSSLPNSIQTRAHKDDRRVSTTRNRRECVKLWGHHEQSNTCSRVSTYWRSPASTLSNRLVETEEVCAPATSAMVEVDRELRKSASVVTAAGAIVPAAAVVDDADTADWHLDTTPAVCWRPTSRKRCTRHIDARLNMVRQRSKKQRTSVQTKPSPKTSKRDLLITKTTSSDTTNNYGDPAFPIPLFLFHSIVSHATFR